MQLLVQTMSWVSALYRSSPAPVLSPSPGSPNTTLNGLWAALDCATGIILWETPSPLTGAMAVSLERDFICLCEAQKVSCCLLVLQNPVGDSPSSCRRKRAASLKGTLIIHNNNNDDSFQLMYVSRQMASCCLLDHDYSSCVRETYKSDLMMSVLHSKVDPCLHWGLLLTELLVPVLVAVTYTASMPLPLCLCLSICMGLHFALDSADIYH